MRRIIPFAALVAVVLASSRTEAGACHDRCGQAYSSCAAVEAVGCELGADLVGKAASELGNQIPIPGMGALFGGLAKKGTKEACQKKLAPCQKIKDTCLAECGPAETSGTTQPWPAAPTITAPVARATFRVFSDRPRSIVYVNGERMGATPQDPLEPFVTPELRVGKYWVRLATPDGEWEWEGAKDVEEGNINAVEGNLENIEEKIWIAALSLDRQGESVGALGAYNTFVERFPNSAKVPEAMSRMSALSVELAAAERELFSRIEGEKSPETRVALCAVYIKGFPAGLNRSRVDDFLAAAQRDMASAEHEAAAFANIQSRTWRTKDFAEIIKLGESYLSYFPDGAHKVEVEGWIADAREKLGAAEAEERRRSVGRTQRGWGVALMAMGGAVSVVGGILGGVTLSQYKDMEEGCGATPEGCSSADRDENHSRAVTTNWLLGVGLVSLAGGVLLYTLAPSSEEKEEGGGVSIGVAPAPNGSGLIVGIGGRL